MRTFATLLSVIGASLLFAGAAAAQLPASSATPEGSERHEEWSYQSSGEQPTPQQIIHQKARVRAEARIRRIETLAAYGMSNSRPTANAAPMTGMFSPAWQRPGGRPWAWFTSSLPQVRIPRTIEGRSK